jgi:hypothetical protein
VFCCPLIVRRSLPEFQPYEAFTIGLPVADHDAFVMVARLLEQKVTVPAIVKIIIRFFMMLLSSP